MFQRIKSSLVGRITLLSIILVSLALSVSGATLLWSFDESLERILENHLSAYTDILIANIKVQNGAVVLDQNAVLSQIPRYWQISAKGKNFYKSERLKGWIVPKPESILKAQRLHVTDSEGNEIEAVQTTLIFPGDMPVTLISGLDGKIANAYIMQERSHLESPLYFILLLEGLFLVATSYLLTRYSISPIRAVNAALRKIRYGKEQRIVGNYPDEIQELSDEINHLLDYTSGIIAKHREFSSNLAHSLKTPMTVIRNESDLDVIRNKVEGMLNIIERNLARVHTAPASNVLSANTKILPVLQDIAQGFGKVYGKSVEIDYPEALLFKGDKADLYEILGNIIENACKFARSKVKISSGNGTVIIEDDGEGIPQSQRRDVLERGTRLDKSKPGTGIGLAIARDIITLYKGDIALESSILSGLKVTIQLPIQR